MDFARYPILLRFIILNISGGRVKGAGRGGGREFTEAIFKKSPLVDGVVLTDYLIIDIENP